ncbi:MAG TPA: hypothetical protein V6D33_11815 [Cyanophyceae cyanobacterium]
MFVVEMSWVETGSCEATWAEKCGGELSLNIKRSLPSLRAIAC